MSSPTGAKRRYAYWLRVFAMPVKSCAQRMK